MASLERFTHGSFPSHLEAAGFTDVDAREVSHNVWPTWHYLYNLAIRENKANLLSKTLRGTLMYNPNLIASLMIWPHRKRLGYNIVTCTKPDIHS
jgi:hypothetical protein